jgi:hypothetical protein
VENRFARPCCQKLKTQQIEANSTISFQDKMQNKHMFWLSILGGQPEKNRGMERNDIVNLFACLLGMKHLAEGAERKKLKNKM